MKRNKQFGEWTVEGYCEAGIQLSNNDKDMVIDLETVYLYNGDYGYREHHPVQVTESLYDDYGDILWEHTTEYSQLNDEMKALIDTIVLEVGVWIDDDYDEYCLKVSKEY